jgi:hypothetical protein
VDAEWTLTWIESDPMSRISSDVAERYVLEVPAFTAHEQSFAIEKLHHVMALDKC